MFDRSAGVTWEAALELLSWKEEGGWATAKAPAVSRMASPFEISCNQRFTALNPIPARGAVLKGHGFSRAVKSPYFCHPRHFCHSPTFWSSRYFFVILTFLCHPNSFCHPDRKSVV